MSRTEDTLARRLGTTPHISALLRKARKLGLSGGQELCDLAVRRGCRHYSHGEAPVPDTVGREQFSDVELAIALLHPSLPHDPHRLRCGAAMVGSEHNKPEELARLARQERAEAVLRYVAECGQKYEPGNPFWGTLLDLLPAGAPIKPGTLPHPSRFVAMTGYVRGEGPKIVVEWLRPQQPAVTG